MITMSIDCLMIVSHSIDLSAFLPLSLLLSLLHSLFRETPSAEIKEIFIGFCSDFKWICGSILNGKVRQSQPPHLP